MFEIIADTITILLLISMAIKLEIIVHYMKKKDEKK